MIATKPRILILCLTGVLAVASCSDDGTSPEGSAGALEGFVVDVSTEDPLSGVAVLLLTDGMDVVAVTGTNGDGRYAFTGLPAGSFLVYPFDEDYQVVQWHDARIRVRGGQTTTSDLRMAASSHSEPYTYRVTGLVTAADTGAPVAGAWIMPIGYGEAGNSVRYLMNNASMIVAVSDADGWYSMPAWPVMDVWPDGEVIGIGPVSCAATGFRPRTFVGAGPSSAHESWLQGGLLPAPADSVLVLDIQLARIPADGLPAEQVGTVRGRIVHEGVPQAGVMVTSTLTTLADPDTITAPEKVAVTGGSMASLEDGRFELHLEPGHYALRAGLLPDDGWCRDGGPGMIQVVAGQTLEVGDVSVGKAIMPVYPDRDEVVPHPLERLVWTSIAGAERYEVELYSQQGQIFGATTVDTFLVMEEEFFLEPGSVDLVWKVYASRQYEPPDYYRIAWFELPAAFTVTATPGHISP